MNAQPAINLARWRLYAGASPDETIEELEVAIEGVRLWDDDDEIETIREVPTAPRFIEEPTTDSPTGSTAGDVEIEWTCPDCGETVADSFRAVKGHAMMHKARHKADESE